MSDKQNIQECCPEFKPELWDNKSHNWQQRKFIKDSMPTIFNMPLPFMIGRKITKMWNAIESTDSAEADKEKTLILFHDLSAFKSEILISVAKEVPETNNVTLSGNYLSKVFDGGYSQVPQFMKEMDEYLEKEGKKATDLYIHYAYCPKCAKKFGHNYMTFFAKI